MDSEGIDFNVFSEDSICYIESLIRSRQHLVSGELVDKLDRLISLELDIAILDSEKAKNERIKNPLDVVRKLK